MNIISSSDNYHGLQAGHFISPTGGCKTWDRDADGYCRGEAVASVVLKSLDAAQADNDNVLAVILSVATNYSAEADSITRPHGPTQERLYKTVLQDAGLHPFDIQYIEMHGTATQAGDVVEMGSVSRVFAPTLPQRPAANPLYVGSVKANVGHGESASGITGLIKSLLIFQEQRLPPHIGIKTSINPKLPDLHPRNIRIPDKAIPLPSANAQGSRRRILLNNFSAAGGNSTCVLEEPPAPRIDETCVDTRSHHIILMSAKSPSALMRNCQNLMSFLQTRPDTSLSHLSYTTTVRRIRHPLRKAFLVASVRQLENELVSLLSTSASMGPSLETKVSRACFCFSGQGSFYSPIAKDLFNSNRQFRSDILSFNNLSENLGLGAFLSIIDGSGSSLNGSEVQVHLAFVALQMALFRFFRSLGIVPSLVLGHSLGEFAALYASGVLSASDTLYLVGHRARLLEDLCQPFAHSMLAVHTDLSTIKQILEEQTHEVEVACVNGPSDVVLSACIDVCEELKSEFKSKGIACRLLKTAYGYHSSQIDPMLRPFEEIAASVEFQKPKVTVASPSTCSIIREANVVCPSYIRDQSRNRVRFYETLRECERDGVVDAASVWIEIGPRPTCSNMVRATLGSQSRVLPSLREGEDAWTTICQSVCFLHQSGLDVDWQFYHRDFEAGQRLLNLPLYAWDQQEYWIPYESDWLLNKVGRSKTLASDQPLQRGPRTTSVQRLVTRELQDKKILLVFETDILEPNIKEIVSGHRVHGCELCPAVRVFLSSAILLADTLQSVYVDIALTIADHVRKHEAPQYLSSGISIHSMEIIHPITLSGALNQGRRLLRIKADADLVADSLSLDIVLCSQQSKTGKSSAKCTVRFENSSNWVSKWSRSSYLIRNRMTSLAQGALEGKTQEILRSTVYQLFSSVVEYDRGYQSIDKVHLNNDDFEAVATLSLQQVKNAGTFFCNPFWLDGLLHISGFIMNANVKLDLKNVFFISNGWDSFRLARPLSSANVYQVYVKMHRLHERQYAGDVCIFHEGSQIGKVKGLKFQQVPGSFFNEIPPSLSPKQHHNSMTAYESHRVAKIQLPTDGPLNVQSVMENPNKGGDVLSLIAEETRIPVYELSPASEFASLGVDSLLSLSIASKMRECFQLDLPYSIFEDFRTIGDLQNHCSKFLANGINHEESELFSTEPNSTSKNGEALPVSVVSRDTDDTEKALPQPSQLPISVVLQGTIKPNQQTLFLFPDGSGSAVSYAKFPQLLPGLCVVGLNSPFLGAGRNVSFAVDDLVKHWIVEIRALCKSGPYILGGWSAGGYYAFEAAKTLIHAGEAVNKVILIDTPPRNCYESIPLGVLHYLSEHKIIGSGMNKVPPLWLTDHFEATICAIDAYTPAPLEGNCQPQVFVIWASDRVESQSRKGSDFDMKISRFLLDRQIDDGLRGWAALFPECQIRVSRAPGSHFSMVSNPNVRPE